MATPNNNTTKTKEEWSKMNRKTAPAQTKFQQKAKQNQDAYSKGSAKYAGGVAASSASHLRNSSGKSVGSAGAGLKKVPYEVKRRMQAMKTQERQNRHARWDGEGGADGGGGIKPAGYDYRMASMGVSNDYSQAANKFAQSMSPPKQSQAPKKPYGGYQSNNPTTAQPQSTDGSMGAGDTRSFNFNPEASSDYWSEQMGNPSVGQNKTPAYQAAQTSADAANEMATKMNAADQGFINYQAREGIDYGSGTEQDWRKYQAELNGYASGGKVNAYVSGGEVAGKGNIPTQPNGDDTLATLKTGEVVLTQEQQAALGGDEAMAQAGVPGFGGNKPADNAPIPAFNQGGLNSPFNFGSAPDGAPSHFADAPMAADVPPAEYQNGSEPIAPQNLPELSSVAGLGVRPITPFFAPQSQIPTPASEISLPEVSKSPIRDIVNMQAPESSFNTDSDYQQTLHDQQKSNEEEAVKYGFADDVDGYNAARASANATAEEMAGYAADESKDNVGFDRKRNKDGTLRRKWDALSADEIMKAQKNSRDTTARNKKAKKAMEAAKPRSKARTGGEGMYGGADSNNPYKLSSAEAARKAKYDKLEADSVAKIKASGQRTRDIESFKKNYPEEWSKWSHEQSLKEKAQKAKAKKDAIEASRKRLLDGESKNK